MFIPRQPYAELVAQGRKTIETRRWNTNFKGKFLIHASKAIDKEISAFLNIDCSKLANGSIIGVACLYAVKKYTSKKSFLADIRRKAVKVILARHTIVFDYPSMPSMQGYIACRRGFVLVPGGQA